VKPWERNWSGQTGASEERKPWERNWSAPAPAPMSFDEGKESSFLDSAIETVKDVGVGLARGALRAPASLDEVIRPVVEHIPGLGMIERAARIVRPAMGGDRTKEALKGAAEGLEQSYSPGFQAAGRKQWWDEEAGTFGDAWSDWRTYTRGIAESLPEQILSMAPAQVLARSAYKTALEKTGDKVAAGKAAARTAMMAGRSTEAAFAAGGAAQNVEEEIRRIPDAQLRDSEVIKSLMFEGLTYEAAKDQIIRDVKSRAMVLAGVATGVFGGLGDRALAKAIAGQAGGLARRAATGAVSEGLLEEFPQSYLSKVGENVAMRAVDPERPLTQGALNEGLGGLAIGSVQGAGQNAIFGRSAEAPAPENAPIPAGDVLGTEEPGTTTGAGASGLETIPYDREQAEMARIEAQDRANQERERREIEATTTWREPGDEGVDFSPASPPAEPQAQPASAADAIPYDAAGARQALAEATGMAAPAPSATPGQTIAPRPPRVSDQARAALDLAEREREAQRDRELEMLAQESQRQRDLSVAVADAVSAGVDMGAPPLTSPLGLALEQAGINPNQFRKTPKEQADRDLEDAQRKVLGNDPRDLNDNTLRFVARKGAKQAQERAAGELARRTALREQAPSANDQNWAERLFKGERLNQSERRRAIELGFGYPTPSGAWRLTRRATEYRKALREGTLNDTEATGTDDTPPMWRRGDAPRPNEGVRVTAATGGLARLATEAEVPASADVAAGLRVARDIFKRRVVFFRYAKPVKPEDQAQGFIIPSDPSTIYINADATRSHLAIIGHELLHSLRRSNGAVYRTLVARMAPLMRDTARYRAWLDAAIQEETDNPKARASEDLVTEELMADMLGDRMNEPEFWRQVLKGLDRSMVMKIRDAVMLTLDVIRSKLGLGRPGLESAQYIKDLDAARKALAQATADWVKSESASPTPAASGVKRDMEALKSRGAAARQEQFVPPPDQIDTDAFKRWSEGMPVVRAEQTEDYEGGPAVFEAFHGTTHSNIQEIDTAPRAGTAEGWLGNGFYVTTSRDDASINYAGEGPDLTGRIERSKEQLADAWRDDSFALDEAMADHLDKNPEDARRAAEELGVALADLDYGELTDAQKETVRDLLFEKAVAQSARAAVAGDSKGLIMPLWVKMKNPFDMRPSGLQLTSEIEYSEDGEDIVSEGGTLVDFANAIRDVASTYDADASEALTDLLSDPEGKSAYDAAALVRSGLSEAYDSNGELVSPGEIIRQAVEALGYDGIIMDADMAFGPRARGPFGIGMQGVYPGTLHLMPFEPTHVKSSLGNSGAFDASVRNILKSRGRRPGATITAETRPSTQLRIGQAVANLSLEELQRYQDNALKAVFGKGGPDVYFRAFGLRPSQFEVVGGAGAYENQVAPNAVATVRADRDVVERVARGWMYVFRQDAVPFFRADPALARDPGATKGVKISFDANVGDAELRAVYAAVRRDVNDGMGLTRLNDREIVLMNFRGDDGMPFVMSDQEFAAGVTKLVQGGNLPAKVKSYVAVGAETGYPYHDWQADPEGRLLRDSLREGGRPNLPAVLGRWADLFRRFAEAEGRRAEEGAQEARASVDAAAHEAATSPKNDKPQPTENKYAALEVQARSRGRANGRTSDGKEPRTQKPVQSRVPSVAAHEASLPQPEEPRLQILRGAGRDDQSSLAAQLRAFSQRHRAKAEPGVDVGSDRPRRQLRARQLSMGDQAAAGGQSSVLSPSNGGRPPTDGGRSGKGVGQTSADSLPAGEGGARTRYETSGSSRQRDADTKRGVDDAAEVGKALGRESANASREDSSGLADRAGADRRGSPGATVDVGAHQAATSPANDLPEPTEAQKKQGNYKVGQVVVRGLSISVENPAGSTRSGVDAGGRRWSRSMKSHYGYIRGGFIGKDGDAVDVFLRPGMPLDYNGPVFVVDQNNPSGRHDEAKVMMGFPSLEEARSAYLDEYEAGWEKRIRSIASFPTVDAFKLWLQRGDLSRPAGDQQLLFQFVGEDRNGRLHVGVDDGIDPGRDKKLPTWMRWRLDRTIHADLRANIASALNDTLRASPILERAAKSVIIWGVHDDAMVGRGGIDGAYWSIFDGITVHEDVAGPPGVPRAINNSQRLIGTIAHELGHALDKQKDGSFLSEIHPAFALTKSGDKIEVSGEVAREVFFVWDAETGPLSELFKYPLATGYWEAMTAGQIRRELFAQLVRAYTTNRELMMQELPHAFRLIDDISKTPWNRLGQALRGLRGKIRRSSSLVVDTAVSSPRRGLQARQAGDRGGEAFQAGSPAVSQRGHSGTDAGAGEEGKGNHRDRPIPPPRRVGVNPAASAKAQQKAGPSALKALFSRAARPGEGGRPSPGRLMDMADAWLKISDDARAFRYGRSNAKTITEIALGMRIQKSDRSLVHRSDIHDFSDDSFSINLGKDGRGRVIRGLISQSDADRTVWVDTSDIRESGLGSAIYQVAMQYAANNEMTFIGDPAAVSPIAAIRRNDQMMSAALRLGTTKWMRPSWNQSVEHAWREVEDQYGDDDRYNLGLLIYDSYANVLQSIDEIKSARYNFESSQFEWRVPRGDDKRTVQQWANDVAATDAGRDSGSGYATILRGIVTQSLLASGARGKRGVSSKHLSPGMLARGDTANQAILYSRSARPGLDVASGDRGVRAEQEYQPGIVARTVASTLDAALKPIGVALDVVDEAIEASRAPALAATRMATKAVAPVTKAAQAINRATDAALRFPLAPVAKVTGRLADRVSSATAAWFKGGAIRQQIAHGIVADYGLPEPYLSERDERERRVNAHLRKSKAMIDQIGSLSMAESRVAYLWMQEKPDTDAERQMMAILPADSRATLAAMKEQIDQLGRDAVELGLLSEESYGRNKMAYLHRSYQKHEVEGAAFVSANRKAKAIRAETYRGRGLRHDISGDRLPGVQKGDKYVRMELRDPGAEGELGKLKRVAYVKEGEPIPAKHAGWRNDGVWEARWFEKNGNVGMWRDLSKPERERLGEIEEIRYAFARTALASIQDIETAKFLKWVGTEYGKATEEEVIAAGGKISEASDSKTTLRAYADNEWVEVPKTNAYGTKLKKYGLLAGQFIPGHIWNDIRATVNFRSASAVWRLWDDLLTAWKISKTALSPAVHTNNVMANVVMADLANLGPEDLRAALVTIIDAKRGDEAASAMMERFYDSGSEGGSFAAIEMRQDVIEPILKQLESERDTVAQNLSLIQAIHLARGSSLKQALVALASTSTAKRLGKMGAAPFKAMIDLYRQEDAVFRLAKFMKETAAGKTDREAGQLARKAFLDYSINAPWIQALRRGPLPFIAFTYRIVPILIDAMTKTPWKMVKYLSVGYALNALAYGMLGAAGDEEEERALLPDERSGRTLLVFPRLLRMPWNDANDSPVFLDVRRWIPGGDIMDLNGSKSAIPVPPWMTVGGPMALMIELISNRSQFTGKDIVGKTDTFGEGATKVMDHIAKFLMPNLPLPNPVGYAADSIAMQRGLFQTYSWKAIQAAGTGETDAFGRERNLPQALSSAFGVKLGSYPADAGRVNLARQRDEALREISQKIGAARRERQRRGISDEEFNARLDRQVTRRRDIEREFAERMGQ